MIQASKGDKGSGKGRGADQPSDFMQIEGGNGKPTKKNNDFPSYKHPLGSGIFRQKKASAIRIGDLNEFLMDFSRFLHLILCNINMV